MRSLCKDILNSYSEILFMKNPWFGGLLLVATLMVPNLAIAGLISVFSAYIFARTIQMSPDFLASGFFTYNPLLVGLAIGYLFKITPLTIFFLITSGISTFILTAFLNSVFSGYLKLPILSLPFVIISSIVYLAASKYSNLYVTSLYAHQFQSLSLSLPTWLSGFFQSLGAIFFLPYVLPGMVIAFIILVSSRILFFMAIIGYYSGSFVSGILLGSFEQSFANINHFNYSLIAMAIGGIFLIPSLKNYLFALISVFMATPLLDSVQIFWSYYGIPGFTLPFVIVTLLFVYVLGLVNYPYLARIIKTTPEETLDEYLANKRRYKGYDRALSLPFSGKWTVWQSFNGKWTHQGNWKYAYDFYIVNEQGQSFRNEGKELTHYYAYRKPIFSPCRGRIVKVIHHLPDNPIGQIDRTNNWGNVIIIYHEQGYFVEISHLAQDSIKVAEGEWVECNQFLGSCGNSGYSPQPHIHLQAQATADLGSYTLPFSFIHYLVNEQYFANDLPKEGESVEPIFPQRDYELKTAFMLDDTFEYTVLKNDQEVDELKLIVRMGPDGIFYFDSDNGKLYFGAHEGTFYFYRLEGNDPYLRMLFLALPRFPLSYRKGMKWTDHVPLGVVSKGIRKNILQFFSSFYHKLVNIEIELSFPENEKVKGIVRASYSSQIHQTYLEFNARAGFKRIVMDNIELRRREHDPANH